MKTKSKNLDFFSDNLQKCFGERLISVLVYGSLLDNVNKINDIDLIIVIRSINSEDYCKIKNIISNEVFIPVQTQILDYNKILKDGIFYSINTCGSFFWRLLRMQKFCTGKIFLVM